MNPDAEQQMLDDFHQLLQDMHEQKALFESLTLQNDTQISYSKELLSDIDRIADMVNLHTQIMTTVLEQQEQLLSFYQDLTAYCFQENFRRKKA